MIQILYWLLTLVKKVWNNFLTRTDNKEADTLNTTDNTGDAVNSSDDLSSAGENSVPVIEDSSGINKSLTIEEEVN